MENTYLFYDLETTGLNKCFDQIIQFAAIRTDKNFNELEKYNFKLALRDDIIMSPEAVLVHRISPLSLKEGLNEYEAVLKIHEIINVPGTISLGYNTLGFDDEFLRFSFYRNLLNPYSHQFKNNCFRMDIFPMAVFYYLFEEDIIKWPFKKDGGGVSLKLENLSLLNNLTKGQAHDALADVEATLNLARIFSRNKKVWEYLVDFFVKKSDQKRSESIDEIFQSQSGIHRMGLFVDSKTGADLNFIAPFLNIGKSIPYKNQSLWLRLDDKNIEECMDNIEEKTFVVRKKYGEPPFILPAYDRFLSKMNFKQKKIMEKNIEYLKSHTSEFNEIVNYHTNYRYPQIEGVDPDAMLYERGFLSEKEMAKCRSFHKKKFEDKIDMIDDFKELEKRQAKRILFRNYNIEGFENIESEKKKYFKSLNGSSRIVDYLGNARLTPGEILSRIEELLAQKTDNEDRNLLNDLKKDIFLKFNQ
ncbi:MAG: exodeoxyribonuclease [Deltaproteobacteria bacterium]|nr:MAG: exodeoxyribonuclease [Deltaproteobacteria bacterium]